MTSDAAVEYSIVPITEHDRERVIDFLNRFFFQDEPLVEYLKILRGPGARCKDLEEFSMASIPQGLSLMAVDTQGRILGLRLTELLTREQHSVKTPDSDREIEECGDPGFKKIWKMLDKVYWETNVFQMFPEVDRVMGFKLMSVDSAYRCQGIAKALIERTIALAKQRNIPMIRVDCTSAYSAKVMVRLGFQLVYSLPYSEYLDSHGQPVFTPKPPHTAVQTFVKRVDSF